MSLVVHEHPRDALRLAAKRAGTLPYVVADAAPGTVPELLSSWGASGRLVIWAGASDATAWGTPEDNWLFRAWHDSCHVRTRLGFTVADEVTLAAVQARAVSCADPIALRVWVEIAEQARYYQRTGSFLPEGAQLAFTLATERDPATARRLADAGAL